MGDGCDINAYRMGVTNFYGPGSDFSVDTTRPFTVVTRFHTSGGELSEIEQVYVQDGKEIHHPSYPLGGGHNDESDDFCAAQKTSFGDRNSFAEKGGMKAMGEALDRGMVLVISLWDDVATGGELTEIESHNDESDDFCAAQKTSFGDRNSFAE